MIFSRSRMLRASSPGLVQAFLQSHISDVLAALMVVVELSIKRLLVGWQTIRDHQPRLLVADFLGLPEGLLSIINFPSLGDHADHMEPGIFIHDIPEPPPFPANLDLHLISMPDIA
jgi:hypothetical protein